MIGRRASSKATRMRQPGTAASFHEWVLSLPWVVERPYSLGTRNVRSFAVDFEPVGCRRLWLVTGLRRSLQPSSIDIAVIVPDEGARALEEAGWGRTVTAMPGRRALVRASAEVTAKPRMIEDLALSAYCWATS